MPRLSVWIIRAALLHLGFGFTLGALLLWNKGISMHPMIWSMLPLHIELVLIGWIVQLTIGVAYWILPRWHTQRRREGLVAASLILLNVGVLLAGSAHWFAASAHLLFMLGRISEALAMILFAIHAWPRIKPLGAQ